MTVRLAVIPCAGAGTRMRPATRVVPKPLITVVDRPVIQYVVEEAVAAGAEEVVLVVDERPGNPVLSHFTEGPPVPGLEDVRFRSGVQYEPLGLGHAVRQARDAVDDEPFMCLLADMFPRPGRSFTPRLVSLYQDRSVLALRPVGREYFFRYGIVSIGRVEHDVVDVTGAVEKPGEAAPSNLGLIGRYVFTPKIFEDLASVDAGHGGEIQLTDAIDLAIQREGATGLVVGDQLFDVGHPAGLVEATAVVGARHLADEARAAGA